METTEKKVGHSEGPWKVVKSAHLDESMIWSDKIVNGDQKHICNVFTTCIPHVNGHEVGRYSRIDREEQLANAKLIAAAPELLESLQWLIKQIPELKGEISLIGMQKCYDTIKKATES